jgi:hypothetical protein
MAENNNEGYAQNARSIFDRAHCGRIHHVAGRWIAAKRRPREHRGAHFVPSWTHQFEVRIGVPGRKLISIKQKFSQLANLVARARPGGPSGSWRLQVS